MVQKTGSTFQFSNLFYAFLGILVCTTVGTNPVFAQTVSDVSESMIESTSSIPGLLTGFSYLAALIFGVRGILKMKEHVENPSQTPLRQPIISLLTGGGLLALPLVYEAMDNLINPGGAVQFDGTTGGVAPFLVVGGITGALGGGLQVFGSILGNIVTSIQSVPGLLTGVAYMLGLVLGVAGLLKIKENVEEPSRTPLSAGVIRLIVGGMLFALPTTYTAISSLITGEEGIAGALAGAYMTVISAGSTAEAGGNCIAGSITGAIGSIGSLFGGGGGASLGSIICNLFTNTAPMTAFLVAVSYLFGLVVGIWGILRIKEHVENPQQVSVWDPVAKIVASAGFFALPYLVVTAYNTLALAVVPHTNSLGGATRGEGGGGPLGLDGMIAALMNDTFSPMSVVINWFAMAAGVIFIMIGVSRLMKSAQEGARGPGGIGTIMTFITGGALLALGPMIGSLSSTLFLADGVVTKGTGVLQYTAGMDGTAIARAETVLDAIILFVMVLGFISIARGIFILRGVSEGSSQASSMSAMTHLIGGAIAVNLGPLLNAVQVTLGIFDLGLGIKFGF